MSFKEALREAKALSGLESNEAIANRSGLDLSSVTRYFQMTDKYCPSGEKIPALCRALGNKLLIEWQAAQVEDLAPGTEPIFTPEQVSLSALLAGAKTGNLSAAAADVMEDKLVTPAEARAMQAHHKELEHFHAERVTAYEPLAQMSDAEWKGHIMEGGKFKTVEVRQ